jgi:hypothetical protein
MPPARSGLRAFFTISILALPLTVDLGEAPTGSSAEKLIASIPIEIGETSSAELPIADQGEERPPVSGTGQIDLLRRGTADQ